MQYKTKSLAQQSDDINDLALTKRINREEYFEQLQLTNKLEGIDTYEKVNEADRAFSLIREHELEKMPIDGKFDLQHLKEIHAYLFQDIYYFAGELRDVPMKIDDVTKFTSPVALNQELATFFSKLKTDNFLKGTKKSEFVSKIANFLTDINVIHPFREGNGRTKRLFFSELAKNAGYKLDWITCAKDEWKMADECAFDSTCDKKRDTSYLRLLLDKSVTELESKNKLETPISFINNMPKDRPPLSSELLEMARNSPTKSKEQLKDNVSDKDYILE